MNMKKIIYFFLLCLAGLLFSCLEDGEISKHEDVHEKPHIGYKRSIVDFQEMKSKLSLSKGRAISLFSNLANKGGDDYILAIDSTYVIQFSNDSLTTFTMGVSTLDDENYSYSNLIIRLMDGETEEFIAHYSPTDEWQTAHNNGEYLPYEGTLQVTDADGVSILDNNEEGSQGKLSTCYFALESEYVECYGSTCPCTDGNGTTNYSITLVCTGSGGGGTPPDYGDPGYPPSGGGGSGSGGSGSGGEDPGLPTDPTEWALMQLEYELEDNTYLLLDLDFPCSQLDKWREVIDYDFPYEVLQRLDYINNQIGFNGFDLQLIEFADGAKVNMDYYPITISNFPINPNTGQAFTPQSFFELMRKSLNSFLSGTPTSFSAYNSTELTKWNSNEYLTSIMRFDIDVNEWITQDGSVICVEQHPERWKFATMRTPQDFDHPVSGVREFGYYEDVNGNYVYYTRGVDRVQNNIQEWIGNVDGLQQQFEEADVLWNKFQDNMVNFVNDFGGNAVENNDFRSIPDWNQLKDVLFHNAPIYSLPGFDNPCE